VVTSHAFFQDANDATYVFCREAVSAMSLYLASNNKGFLTFSVDGTKWKNRYFILVSGHMLLYIFEAEDSTKPKGVINLSGLSIVSLDESMFKRKFW
jgi:hypothetical protein